MRPSGALGAPGAGAAGGLWFSGRRGRPAFDAQAYKARNLIERAFCRMRDWGAIATRYDKTARNFLAGICLAVAISGWLQ